MTSGQTVGKGLLIIFLAIAIGVPLYALPATLSLPDGCRLGIENLTLSEASQQLRKTGETDWSLVEAARALVAKRMQYSRRNSFDTAAKAFERGYGYCTQQAYALTSLLIRLGFDTKVVQAFHNRFPDGGEGSHAWVRVTVDQETRQIDAMFYDTNARAITFEPLSEVTDISPTFKAFAWWGGAAVNAHRYYLTGKDE
jgi:hypothetical protein